jgi:hypothetical protein
MKSVLVQAGSPPDPGVDGMVVEVVVKVVVEVVVGVVVEGPGVIVLGHVGGGSVGFGVVVDTPDGVVLGGRSQSGCK